MIPMKATKVGAFFESTLFNGPFLVSFWFIFGIFKQTLLQFLQQINVKNVMSIQYMVQGFKPMTFRP